MKEKIKAFFNKVKDFMETRKIVYVLASIIMYIFICGVMLMHMGPWMFDAVVVPYLASAVATFFIGMMKDTYDSYFRGGSKEGSMISYGIGIFIGLILALIIFV